MGRGFLVERGKGRMKIKQIFANDYINVDLKGNDRLTFLRKNPASVIILVQHHDQFIFIRQYRHPLEQYIIQLPGGGVENDEELESAARRELLEETGIRCGRLEYYGKIHPSPWMTNAETHVFFTEEIIDISVPMSEEYEKIETISISIKKCYELVRIGELTTDAELHFALFQYALRNPSILGQNHFH